MPSVPPRETTSSDDRPVDHETGTRSVDAAALKALSHPLRLRILTQLGASGRANVKGLAAALDEPTNSVSYHLSQLAQHGLVVPAERPEGAARREKWWELPEAGGMSYRSETIDGPAERAALAGWFSQRAVDNVGRVLDQIDAAHAEGRPGGVADVGAWLTSEEADRVARLLDEAVDVVLAAQERHDVRADDAPEGHGYYQLMSMLAATGGDVRSSSRTDAFSASNRDDEAGEEPAGAAD